MKTSLTASAAALSALLLAACGGETSSASAKEETGAPAVSTTTSARDEPVEPAELGRRYFTICGVCHATTDDAPPRQGPNLKGVYGAPSARLADYNYSQAFRAAGLTWTEDNLDAYIENPQKLIPGNKMAYAGERNPEKRRAIIAYLKSLSEDEPLEE